MNGPEPTYEVKLRVPPPPPLGSSWSECQNVPTSTKKKSWSTRPKENVSDFLLVKSTENVPFPLRNDMLPLLEENVFLTLCEFVSLKKKII